MSVMEFTGHVERVVDGDTLDVAIDLGFRIQFRTRIRLAGIDTPELNSPDPEQRAAAHAARDFVAGLIFDHPDHRVTLLTSKPDKYGRTLADVILPDGSDLVAAILEAGHGRLYDGGVR